MGSYFSTSDEIETPKQSINQYGEREPYKPDHIFDKIETKKTPNNKYGERELYKPEQSIDNNQSVKTEPKKSDLGPPTPIVRLVSSKNGKFIIIFETGGGMYTSGTEIWNLTDYISKDNDDDINEETFLKFRNRCSFFPVRRQGDYYQQMMDLYFENRMMFDQSKKIMSNYTSSKLYYERLNIYLAIDHPSLKKYVNEIKNLKGCITQQFPKHYGLCYFKTRMSVVEIWSFRLKNTFYIPNFILTKVNRDNVSEGNVLFIIDTKDCNKFTTLVTLNNECLISCYNVFQWVDYSFNPEENFVTVKLKIIDDDLLTQPSTGKDNGDIPENYLKNINTVNYDIQAKDLNDALLHMSQIQ
jgi:hypothetical protein